MANNRYRVPWCIPTKQTYRVMWSDDDGCYETDFIDWHEALEFIREHTAYLTDWGIGRRDKQAWMICKYHGVKHDDAS